jgi:hypothetical protein
MVNYHHGLLDAHWISNLPFLPLAISRMVYASRRVRDVVYGGSCICLFDRSSSMISSDRRETDHPKLMRKS